MQTESRVDKNAANRKIAEWLGWESINGNYYRWINPEGKWRSRLPDFYTDEAANALVLEKMPELWACIFRDDVHGGWYVGHGSSTLAFNADRKTAICAAALKLIEGEG